MSEPYLIPVDPEEVDLPEVEDAGGGEIVGPVVLAAGALVALLPVAVHDRLQDGGERGHADPRPDQHRVLRAEYLRRRRAERAVDEHLQGKEEVEECLTCPRLRDRVRFSCALEPQAC